jgi:prepilin-type N-terminal cleavage/methylation domain-containing protein/prepilin-type processing-associated H-X9-DG protein
MKRKKAFTLIELLVVIAIIALLVSILLPSLNRAKDLAKKTVCLSQMKGIGLTAMMYADDNNDCLPMTSIHNTAAFQSGYVLWYHLLSPYAGEKTSDSYYDADGGVAFWEFSEIFKACPSDPVRLSKGTAGPWNSGYGMVVAVQSMTGRDLDTDGQGGYYHNRISETQGEKYGVENAGHLPRFFKRSEFSDSARRGWIGDSSDFHIGGGPNDVHDEDKLYYPTWARDDDPSNLHWGNDPERHAGSSNIWFIDGHAKDYKYNIGGNAFYDIEKLPW